MLLGTLGASLLENKFGGKGFKHSKTTGQGVIRAGDGLIRSWQNFQCCIIL